MFKSLPRVAILLPAAAGVLALGLARGRVARKYTGPFDPEALENDILEELDKKTGAGIL